MSKLNSRLWKEPDTSRRGLSGFLIIALALMMAAFIMPADVSADSGGYTTPSYDVNVVTDEDHVFHVSEEIHVDFNMPRHGIYRYIPDGGRYYDVRNVSVQGYDYQVYSESGNTVVQIGNGDYYVDGSQTYRVSYDIVGYKDDSDAEDYLSLDLLPTGWNTEIGSASLRIEFPKEIDDIKTYVGAYGSESMDGYFDVSTNGRVYTAVSRQTLPQGVGLTISATLPEGYWVGAYTRDESLPLIYGLLAMMGMLMLLLWFAIGRDNPVIPTVEFYPPEDMDPLEIAYVGNDDVSTKDISALFLWMASKGYVEIRSDGKKSFTLVKKADLQGEEHHTREIFRTLFSGRQKVQLQNLPSRFGEVAASIPSDVKKTMEKRKPSFSAASKAGRAVGLAFCLIIPATAAIADAWLTHGAALGTGLSGLILALIMFISMTAVVGRTDAFRTKKKPIGIILGMIIFLGAALAETWMILQDYPLLAVIFLCSILAAGVATIFVRRRMNNELYGRVLGFREFIKTAEYDRLKMLSDENPEYFFNIMPYACVFGMSTKWADKFADFQIPQPSWYHTPTGMYDPFFGTHMYYYSGNSIAGAVASHYKAVGADILSSAVDSGTGGGGGFSGGGFSGGGFGGGGGGSW